MDKKRGGMSRPFEIHRNFFYFLFNSAVPLAVGFDGLLWSLKKVCVLTVRFFAVPAVPGIIFS